MSQGPLDTFLISSSRSSDSLSSHGTSQTSADGQSPPNPLTLTPLCTLSHHGSDVNCVAAARDVIATCSSDKTVGVFTTRGSPSNDGNQGDSGAAGKADQAGLIVSAAYSPLRDHKYQAIACDLSQDARLLVSCSVDGTAKLYSVPTGSCVGSVSHEGMSSLRTCRFAPRANLMVSGCVDGSVCVWDVDSLALKMRYASAHEMSVVTCAFSPDNLWLVTACTAGNLKVWDAQYFSNTPCLSLHYAHDLGLADCHFSSVIDDDRACRLVTSGQDCLLKIWRLFMSPKGVKLESLLVLSGHTGPVYACQFSPTGSYVVSGGVDYSIRLWESVTGACLTILDNAHTKFINSLAFSDDESHLISASTDRTVKVWAIVGIQATEELVRERGADERQGQADKPDEKSLTNWSVADVCLWVQRQQLPSELVQTFKENNIDGQELSSLDHASLETGLKITSLGLRNKIIRAVKMEMFLPGGLGQGDQTTPHELLCPITHELMSEPVVASDGYSYERTAIEAWISKESATSPLTNTPLDSGKLIPNRNLKMLIHRYKQKEVKWIDSRGETTSAEKS